MRRKEEDIVTKLKGNMTYSRTYRYLAQNKWRVLLVILVAALPFSLFTFFCYPQLTTFITNLTKYILQGSYAPGELITSHSNLVDWVGEITYLGVPGRYPTLLFNWLNLLFTLIALLVLTAFVKVRPWSIFATVMLFVHLFSSLFFVFVPWLFPYIASEYSSLYLKQQMLMLFFTPFILGSSIAILPCNIFLVFVAVLGCYVYFFVFCVVRYVIFLYILSKVSILYMASLFFTFGPFIDFLYIVAIYSLVVNKVSGGLNREKAVWKW